MNMITDLETKQENEQLLLVMEKYEIECRNIEKLNNGSSNKNWVVNSLDKQYVLKRMTKIGNTDEFCKFQNWLSMKLVESNYPYVPNLHAEDYSTILDFDNYLWQLRPYIYGRFHEIGNKKDLLKAVDALLKLQSISIGESLDNSIEVFNYWYNNSVDKLSKVAKIIQEYVKSESADEMLLLYQRVLQDLEIFDLKNVCFDNAIVHGDFHSGNLIFNNSELHAVIDWDTAQVQPKIYDFAKSLYLLTRKRHGGFEVDQDALVIFVKRYCQHQKLCSQQIELVPLLLEVTYLPRPDYLLSFGEDIDKLKWYINWTYDAVKMVKGQLKYLNKLIN